MKKAPTFVGAFFLVGVALTKWTQLKRELIGMGDMMKELRTGSSVVTKQL